MSKTLGKKKKPSLTYKDAGLDLKLYDQAMARLPALMKRTHTPRVLDLPGGFAGMFRLGKSRKFPTNYDDPVLVSGTDGVGTKLKVAILAGIYETVGIDLVAMSVNDCLCTGGEPLMFLDYLALPKDDPALIKQLISGICDGCLDLRHPSGQARVAAVIDNDLRLPGQGSRFGQAKLAGVDAKRHPSATARLGPISIAPALAAIA